MKRTLWLAAFAVAALAVSAPALAQPSGGGTGALQFRVGGFFPSAGGEFWKANTSAYTLEKSDFNDGTFGMSWIAPMNNYLEVGFNFDVYSSTARSADRNFQDQFGDPILHDTTLRLLPLTVDLRVLPAGRYAMRGRGGRMAVRQPVPYVGAGLGMNYWEFEEEGDFVASDNSIVFDRVKDSGTAFEGHVLAGVELPVSPAWSINFEGRYSWSKATPNGPLADIYPDKIDLGGASVFFGGTLRF